MCMVFAMLWCRLCMMLQCCVMTVYPQMACTIMGFELFGGMTPLYFGLACFTAYTFSGNTGIYVKQYIAKVINYMSDLRQYSDWVGTLLDAG